MTQVSPLNLFSSSLRGLAHLLSVQSFHHDM
jgi:hypothetical protein